MKLYGITEDDVGAVYAHGSKNTTARSWQKLNLCGIITEADFATSAYPLKE